MKKLIYRYLGDVYYWDDIVIRSKSDDKKVLLRHISKNLTLVFGLTKKQTKWYLKGWCKKNNKSFLFNQAWYYTWQNETTYYHAADAAAKLTRMLSEQIANEITNENDRGREILNYVLNLVNEQVNT
jgi:hypothetical protein